MKKTNKLLSAITGIIVAAMAFSGCSSAKSAELLDREGNSFTMPKQTERIISMAPSNTEIIEGLGLSDKLVAVDECSYDVEGIDENLPKLALTNPDAETIVSLKPDIVIASGSNKIGDDDPFAQLKEAGITVVYIPNSTSIEGICEDIEFIAKVTGTEKKGEEMVSSIKADVEEIKKIGDSITDKKKVYFELGEWSGLYTFGKDTFLNEFIETAGAVNIFGDQESWITATPESVLEANPDVIIVNSPGTNQNGETAVEAVKNRDGWDTITAVKENNVYEVEANASSRPSQKSVKALKQIAKAIYPDEYKDIQE